VMYYACMSHTSRRDRIHYDHYLMMYSRDCDRSNTWVSSRFVCYLYIIHVSRLDVKCISSRDP